MIDIRILQFLIKYKFRQWSPMFATLVRRRTGGDLHSEAWSWQYLIPQINPSITKTCLNIRSSRCDKRGSTWHHRWSVLAPNSTGICLSLQIYLPAYNGPTLGEGHHQCSRHWNAELMQRHIWSYITGWSWQDPQCKKFYQTWRSLLNQQTAKGKKKYGRRNLCIKRDFKQIIQMHCVDLSRSWSE